MARVDTVRVERACVERHSCPLPWTFPATITALEPAPKSVIPTEGGAPATTQWRNLLFAASQLTARSPSKPLPHLPSRL